jgi:hypothetical protein
VCDLQKIPERGGESYRIGYNLKLQVEYLLVLRAGVRDGTLPYADFMTEFPAIQCHVRVLSENLSREDGRVSCVQNDPTAVSTPILSSDSRSVRLQSLAVSDDVIDM